MADYDINYDDQRFKEVESDKKAAISENEKLYSGMIKDSDGYYQAQIDAAKDWEKKQTDLQNQQTDFAIEQIEQQKTQAKKDYTKEQSGAYVDWQKESNKYGARSEQIASQGLAKTGYSESSQTSLYNTYQNRVMTARESYNNAVLNYNNAIKDARLQNSAVLAEIAYKALQQQLELSLQGFQYKNTLLLDKANKKTELEQMFHERWQDVLGQINTENSLAEQVRQFNESMALEREQWEWQKAQAAARSSGGGGGGGGGSSRSSDSNNNDKKNSDKISTLKSGSSSSSGDLPSETAKSILNLGQGPISASHLAGQVASGKVQQSTSSSGAPVFNYTGFSSAALSGKKPFGK
jgi:hypothetical protein